jgi:hypothetical protein
MNTIKSFVSTINSKEILELISTKELLLSKDLSNAKNEIDLIAELADRLEYAENLTYSIDGDILIGTFECPSGFSDTLNKFTSLAVISEEPHEDVSLYTVKIVSFI